MELSLGMISNRVFKFSWGKPMNETQVEVSIPNLRELKYSVWGDWGSMYSFDLTEEEPIRIKYNNDEVEIIKSKLRIESPMFTRERKVFPYFLVIEDQNRGLKFNLYINDEYSLGKIEVIETKNMVKLFEKIEVDYIEAVGLPFHTQPYAGNESSFETMHE